MANIVIFPTWLDSIYQDLVLPGSQDVVSGTQVLVNATVPVGERYFITNIHISADADATFQVSIGGILLKRIKNSVEQRSIDVGFGGGAFKRAVAGQVVRVDVTLDEENDGAIPTFACVSGYKEALP